MKLPGSRQSAAETFDPVSIVGEKAANAIELAYGDRVDARTRNPFSFAGIEAANHLVAFGTTGFGQYSNEKAVNEALTDEIRWHTKWDPSQLGRSVEVGMYTPVARAAAVLYGRQPDAQEQAGIKPALLKSAQERFGDAQRYRSWDKAPFYAWYTASRLADIRLLLGEDEFRGALSTIAQSDGRTVEAAKGLLIEGTRKRLKQSTKGGLKLEADKHHPVPQVIEMIADLRLLQAAEVTVTAGEHIQITDVQKPAIVTIPAEAADMVGFVTADQTV